MKNLRYIILIFCAYGAIGQPVPQIKKVTEKFFPDSKLTITTPAFQKDKGFTDHAEMMAFLDAMVAAHPDFISYTAIGESQKGKSIPLVPLTHRAAGASNHFLPLAFSTGICPSLVFNCAHGTCGNEIL